MTIPTPGELLTALLSRGPAEAVLVAPFVKVEALKIAIGALPASCSLTVVTRWRPEEVRAGVSDLEVWEVLNARPTSALRLCDRLHAKYYRAGNDVLLGSANLTGLGMGWRAGANIELLRPDRFEGALIEFERFVLNASTLATQDVRDLTAAAAAELPAPPPVLLIDENAARDLAQQVRPPWLPVSRYPENVWLLYSGQPDRVTSAARHDGEIDLCAMTLPCGLSRTAFDRYVGALLAQVPVVQRLDTLARERRRFGEIRRVLERDPDVTVTGRSSRELLQTLMRWLVHFLPRHYTVHVTRFSESLRRHD